MAKSKPNGVAKKPVSKGTTPQKKTVIPAKPPAAKRPPSASPGRKVRGVTAAKAQPVHIVIAGPVAESIVVPPVFAREITHQEIAVRAYEIYRARIDQTPEDDWRRAEWELKGAM